MQSRLGNFIEKLIVSDLGTGESEIVISSSPSLAGPFSGATPGFSAHLRTSPKPGVRGSTLY